MALLKSSCCASIFLTRLRFPSGLSTVTICLFLFMSKTTDQSIFIIPSLEHTDAQTLRPGMALELKFVRKTITICGWNYHYVYNFIWHIYNSMPHIIPYVKYVCEHNYHYICIKPLIVISADHGRRSRRINNPTKSLNNLFDAFKYN